MIWKKLSNLLILSTQIHVILKHGLPKLQMSLIIRLWYIKSVTPDNYALYVQIFVNKVWWLTRNIMASKFICLIPSSWTNISIPAHNIQCDHCNLSFIFSLEFKNTTWSKVNENRLNVRNYRHAKVFICFCLTVIIATIRNFETYARINLWNCIKCVFLSLLKLFLYFNFLYLKISMDMIDK